MQIYGWRRREEEQIPVIKRISPKRVDGLYTGE